MKTTGVIALVLAFTLALSSSAFAAADIKAEALVVGETLVSCQIDAAVSLTGRIQPTTPSINYSISVNALKADQEQLHALAVAGDAEGYKALITGKYKDDFASLKVQLISIKALPLSGANKLKLVADYLAVVGDYAKCVLTPYKNYLNLRIDQYDNAIEEYQAKVDALQAKGVDTTELNSVLSGARTQILAPLRSDISASENYSAVFEALGKYCMFDGCKTGTNYHLVAKFEIAKLNAIIAYLEAQYPTADFTTAKGYIASSKTTLDAVGTTSYTDEQKVTLLRDLGLAAKSIKDSLKAANVNVQAGA